MVEGKLFKNIETFIVLHSRFSGGRTGEALKVRNPWSNDAAARARVLPINSAPLPSRIVKIAVYIGEVAATAET